VENVLGKLGMAEDEAIESKMVARRIRGTQQEIERKAFGSFDAESAAQWLEKNCPNLANK